MTEYTECPLCGGLEPEFIAPCNQDHCAECAYSGECGICVYLRREEAGL